MRKRQNLAIPGVIIGIASLAFYKIQELGLTLQRAFTKNAKDKHKLSGRITETKELSKAAICLTTFAALGAIPIIGGLCGLKAIERILI